MFFTFFYRRLVHNEFSLFIQISKQIKHSCAMQIRNKNEMKIVIFYTFSLTFIARVRYKIFHSLAAILEMFFFFSSISYDDCCCYFSVAWLNRVIGMKLAAICFSWYSIVLTHVDGNANVCGCCTNGICDKMQTDYMDEIPVFEPQFWKCRIIIFSVSLSIRIVSLLFLILNTFSLKKITSRPRWCSKGYFE